MCDHCGLRCSTRSSGEPYALRDVDLLIDSHWALPLSRLDGVPYRLIFYHWDPGKMGTYFHDNGNLLETVGAAETFVAQAQTRPSIALSIRVNQEMRSSGGYLFNFRKVFALFGFPKPVINKLIASVVNKTVANFTKELQTHMAKFKAG